MNRTELVAALAAELDLSKAEVERFERALEATIVAEVAAGREVRLSNFAVFGSVQREARQGRNPNTGQVMQIPAKRAVKVRALKGFEDAVKG